MTPPDDESASTRGRGAYYQLHRLFQHIQTSMTDAKTKPSAHVSRNMDVDADKLYRDFWHEFGNRVSQREDTPLYVDPELDLTRNYLPLKDNLPAGVNNSLVLSVLHGYLQVKFHIRDHYTDRNGLYTYLSERKEDIESHFNHPLEWSQQGNVDTILLQRDATVKTRAEWDDYINWLVKYGERFNTLFGYPVARSKLIRQTTQPDLNWLTHRQK